MFNIIKLLRDNKKQTLKYIFKNWLFFPAIFAFVFSLPIYLNIYTYLNESYFPYINSIFVLISIYVYLNIDKKNSFMFGFFIGIFWFYWIGLSFRYTNSPILIYIIPIVISIIYATLIYFALFFKNIIFRIITLSLIGYVVLFGFDWFVPDAMLSFSVFKVDKFSFILLTIVVAIISIKKMKLFRFFAVFLLFFTIEYDATKATIPSNKIMLTQTNMKQEEKWDIDSLKKITKYNISLIENAIENGYEIVVLPETAFPIPLNTPLYTDIMDNLKTLSQKITIITGAQRYDQFGTYNTTYAFNGDTYNFADKVFLAPFGEYMPIPGFIANFFAKIFKIQYSGFDISKQEPANIYTKNLIFRNAICYEATTRQVYKDNPKYMMLISNNMWFKPSSEPILQMILIKYYARLYNTIVFYSANGSKSGIITPNISLKFHSNIM